MKKEASFPRKHKEMSSHNKRRDSLGVKVHNFDFDSGSFFADDNSRYLRGCSSAPDIKGQVFSRSDRWKMLHRARSFLSRRSFDDVCGHVPSAYCKDKGRTFVTLLDYFPSLKYSYSAPLPGRVLANRRGVSGCDFSESTSFIDVYRGSFGKARLSDLSRSGSIRLDPVDAPRQLFHYRRRIQRCISWSYSVGLVPLMMTVTVFHRWHPLRGLLNVLSKAWNYFFTGTTAAVKRAKRMGLSGYIRRAEETINNCKDKYNSGWHPHYHVILFVPFDKVSVVASMEDELREAWFHAVNRFFEKEFGECIAPGYEASFRQHGLFFSRVSRRSLSLSGSSSADDDCGDLRHVDDSEYMAKVIGCGSSSLYCGDSELTSVNAKSSRVPFDLLLEDTAENVDLWVEYALATKGVRSFVFSRGLESCVNDYFVGHPDEDPIEPFVKTSEVIARLGMGLYKLVERHFRVDEMLRVASSGYVALRVWIMNFCDELGLSFDDMLLLPFGSSSYDLLRFTGEDSVGDDLLDDKVDGLS